MRKPMSEDQCPNCNEWFDTEESYVFCPKCHDKIAASLRERQVNDEPQR